MTDSGKSRRKKWTFSYVTIAAVLLSLTLVISCGLPALAVSSEIRIDETTTLLEDSSTRQTGYLTVEAETPVGFEGTLCVDLQRKWSFQKTTIQISPIDYYIGGQYLEPGDYTVKKAYALSDDTVAVEADLEEVTVALDGDAHLLLTVTSDPASEEAWLAMMETYTLPDLPTDAAAPDESIAPTETSPTIDTTPGENEDKGTEPEQGGISVVEVSIVKSILGLMKSLAITALFGAVVYFAVEYIRARQS